MTDPESMKMTEMVGAHPFFEGLNEEHLKTVLGCVSNVKFNEGDYIARIGAECNQFYLLRHGSVSIELFSPERGAIQIQTVSDGDLLGWSWLIPPYKWKFDARALTLTRAFAVNGSCLRQKVEQDHSLGYELYKRISLCFTERLEATRLQLLDLYGVHN